MSEPATYTIIRDGQARYYGSRWGGVFVFRELVWGPDAFEAWATQHEEFDGVEDEEIGGVVADFDRKRLIYQDDFDALRIPKVEAVFKQLLQAAWPGYELLSTQRGLTDRGDTSEPGLIEAEYDERSATIQEAARIYDDVDEDLGEIDEEGFDEPAFDDDDIRAWITIVDAGGVVRHRDLELIPYDLINANDEAIETLGKLRPAEVPPEKQVAEGMWIDESTRTIGVWGSNELKKHIPGLQQHWDQWTVLWADRGYAEQCEVSGPSGVPLGEAQALALILPTILSTKRFDMSTVLGALGGGLKKTAIKATGCLLFVICLPVIILGIVSGNWQPVLITIGITCAIVITIFKVIEVRFKKSFRNAMPDEDEEDEIPAVAGPLDEGERRRSLEGLLVSAGLPGLAVVEPLFPEESEFDLLD